MQSERLDLDELEKLVAETEIDESWFDDCVGRSDGTLHIGNGIIAAGYVDGEDAHKLLKLFKALPRLIEMAGIARSLGAED